MPLQATVTPLSLYMLDDSVFDGLQLPTPPTNPTDYPDLYVAGFSLDREILVDSILMATGEMDCIYPDPVFFKYAVTSWSKKELPVWQALYDTLFYKYNPLWNKDGTVKETAKDLTTNSTTGSRSRSGAKEDRSSETGSGTDTHDLRDEHTGSAASVGSEIHTGATSESSSDNSSEIESKTGSSVSSQTGALDKSGSSAGSESVVKTNSSSSSEDIDGATGSENKVSAYNDATYQNRDRTDGTELRRTERSDSGSETGSTQTDSRDDSHEEHTEQTAGTDSSVSERSGSGAGSRSEQRDDSSTDQRTQTDSSSDTHGGTITRSDSNTRTSAGTEQEQEITGGSEEGSLDHELTRTEQGNIGVTMTTQLIAAQRELVQLNFYDLIVERFKERFCLLVY